MWCMIRLSWNKTTSIKRVYKTLFPTDYVDKMGKKMSHSSDCINCNCSQLSEGLQYHCCVAPVPPAGYHRFQFSDLISDLLIVSLSYRNILCRNFYNIAVSHCSLCLISYWVSNPVTQSLDSVVTAQNSRNWINLSLWKQLLVWSLYFRVLKMFSDNYGQVNSSYCQLLKKFPVYFNSDTRKRFRYYSWEFSKVFCAWQNRITRTYKSNSIANFILAY